LARLDLPPVRQGDGRELARPCPGYTRKADNRNKDQPTMKRILDTDNNFGRIWTAETAHFVVSLILEQSFEKYDGEDENGEIQAELDSGELVMFDSKVVVEFYANDKNLIEIGADYLGRSVYKDGETVKFMGDGYFKDMLANACAEARRHVAAMPKVRAI
jgi:hypothetical protein